MITINDMIKVRLGGAVYEVPVAGLERGCGTNSPITVKFYIDWEEGPMEYDVHCQKLNQLQVGKLPGI